MKTKIPVRKLAQSNWLMALASCGFLSTFLFTYQGLTNEILFIVTLSTINILVVSFLHIFILIKLEKYTNKVSYKWLRFYRYLIGYVVTLVYSYCVHFVRELFADTTWRVSTFQQQLITIFVGGLGLNILIIVMHNLVIAYHVRNDTEVENAELKAANAEANNQLLKQQIHPHFLFNALNILKALYKKDSCAGDAYIVHLANFLRASLSNTAAKLVRLHDEIKMCDDYIAMQKIRFGDALHYQMDITDDESINGFVPSFSLQPLLENAIKHNDITDEKPLFISLRTKDGYVSATNNLQRKTSAVISTGNGLVNLVKRYRLISGDDVLIQEEEGFFSVRLKILKA